MPLKMLFVQAASLQFDQQMARKTVLKNQIGAAAVYHDLPM
jgi:hypothetical protein